MTRRGERGREKEWVENQRDIFTVVACEGGREGRNVLRFIRRGKIEEKRGTNARRRWRPSPLAAIHAKLNNREVI